MLKGHWLYDRQVKKPVYIVRCNYDYHYELCIADGLERPESGPELNADGYAFYVAFDDRENFVDVQSGGAMSLDEAKRQAEEMLPSAVCWD